MMVGEAGFGGPASTGTWVRGSFHGHCSEHSRCATVSLAAGVAGYASVGADFVTLTDHGRITDLDGMRRRYPSLVFLEGFERSEKEHLVFTGERVSPPLYELSLEEALEQAGPDLLTIVCHPRPNASGPEYWTLDKVAALGTWPDGIEVYNGHYGTTVARAHGRQPLGTSLWDEVLTAGHRLWGFANDDFHDPVDLGNAWNMVWVDEVTPRAIVAAARAGRCYATTGLLLRDLTVADDELQVELQAPATGTFIGPEGQALSRSTGTRFAYRGRGEPYIRFEAEGEAGRIFLQPVFATAGPE